jgi:hypothetical protein
MTTTEVMRLLGTCPCGAPAQFACAEDPDTAIEPRHFSALPAATLRPALAPRCDGCLDGEWDRIYPLDGPAMLGELAAELTAAGVAP